MLTRRRSVCLGVLAAATPVAARADDSFPCERQDCRLIMRSSWTTLIGQTIVTDRNGNPVGPSSDPNITTMHQECLTCGAMITRTQGRGVTSWSRQEP